jgi:hypothetical protein
MMTKTPMIVTTLVGLLFATGGASAGIVCFDQGGVPSTCTASNEQRVFLERAKDVMTDFGNVGRHRGLPLVEFTSTDSLDFANGFATITPFLKGRGSSFDNLDITMPGHTFTDLIFDLQLVNPGRRKSTEVDVTALLAGGGSESFDYTGLRRNADLIFIVQATTGSLTEVDLTSATGIKLAKHFEVSGVAAVPELWTWAMLGLGFAGLGFAGYRKSRRF